MNITILGGPFLSMPPAPCGAVERAWQGLAEVFAARGHRVQVVCRRHPGQAAEETVAGVHYLRHMSFVSGGRLAVNLLKDLAYSVRVLASLPRADVLVTNAFWLPALAARFRRSAGRVAVHVARMPKGQLFLYNRVHRLHAVSQAVQDAIAKERPQALPRVRVIPYPVDTRYFTPPASRPEGRTILYAGRVHPEKGLDLLLDAFARLDVPANLKIVGPWEVERGGGGKEYLDALRQKAAGRAVEFVDAVSDRHQLADVYRRADLFCYPSLAEQGETFGVAPLEAMATGLVPVVSGLACFRDFIDDATGRVFDHRAADASSRLAECLSACLADPVQLQSMGRRCADRAAALNYDHVADRYLADFAEMVAE